MTQSPANGSKPVQEVELNRYNNIFGFRVVSTDSSLNGGPGYRAILLRGLLAGAGSVYDQQSVGPGGMTSTYQDGLPIILDTNSDSKIAEAILTAFYNDFGKSEKEIEKIVQKLTRPFAQYVSSLLEKRDFRIRLDHLDKWVKDNIDSDQVKPFLVQPTLDEIVENSRGLYLTNTYDNDLLRLYSNGGTGKEIAVVEDWSKLDDRKEPAHRTAGYILARELGFSRNDASTLEFIFDRMIKKIPNQTDYRTGSALENAIDLGVLAEMIRDAKQNNRFDSLDAIGDLNSTVFDEAGVIVAIPRYMPANDSNITTFEPTPFSQDPPLCLVRTIG